MTIKTMAAGLVTGGLLIAFGGLSNPAAAYPPGTGMTVTATPTSGPTPTTLTVNVAQVKPGCTVSVTAKSANTSATGVTTADASGSATINLSVPTGGWNVRVSAKTVSCDAKEPAVTTVKVIKPKLYAVNTVKVKTPFTAYASRFPAGSTVTFVAQLGYTTVTATATAGADGKARASLSLPFKGTWVIVASSGGSFATDTVTAYR